MLLTDLLHGNTQLPPSFKKGNCRFFDAARMGITSQSIDIRPGDIVSQAGDNRMHDAHLPGNLRVVRFYAEYITFQT